MKKVKFTVTHDELLVLVAVLKKALRCISWVMYLDMFSFVVYVIGSKMTLRLQQKALEVKWRKINWEVEQALAFVKLMKVFGAVEECSDYQCNVLMRLNETIVQQLTNIEQSIRSQQH